MDPNVVMTTRNKLHDPAAKPTKNKAGGLAYEPDAYTRLYLETATWLVSEPKFYGDNRESISSHILEMTKSDPQFVLDLARYLRTKMHMRTGPQVLLATVALYGNLKKGEVRKACREIIQRPDDILSCLSFVRNAIGDFGDKQPTGSVPSSLKKGIADALEHRFYNPYILRKYARDTRMFKLADAVKLCHPKPGIYGVGADAPLMSRGDQTLFKQLIEGTLPIPDTWETIISAEGSSHESWTKAAKVMPYMATLRNLRNLIIHNVDMSESLSKLSDTKRVLNSKQFPYRFYSAYRALTDEYCTNQQSTQAVADAKVALEKAMDISVQNLPRLSGRAAVFADASGSMTNPVSDKSEVRLCDIAFLFMAMASHIWESALTGVFSADYHDVTLNPKSGILKQMALNPNWGYETNAYKPIERLIATDEYVDTVVMISDMEIWDTGTMYRWGGTKYISDQYQRSVLEYRNKINPNVQIVNIDLAGYGTMPLPESLKVLNIGGYSDKLFDMLRFINEPNPIDKVIRS